jgi:hypothetical protein
MFMCFAEATYYPSPPPPIKIGYYNELVLYGVAVKDILLYCSLFQSVAQFLSMFAKLRKATISFIMCVCPQGTTWLPLGRFS